MLKKLNSCSTHALAIVALQSMSYTNQIPTFNPESESALTLILNLHVSEKPIVPHLFICVEIIPGAIVTEGNMFEQDLQLPSPLNRTSIAVGPLAAKYFAYIYIV